MNWFNHLQKKKTQHQINLHLRNHLIKLIRFPPHLLLIQSQCLIHLQYFLLVMPTQEVILILIRHILSNNLLACGMSRARHRDVDFFLLLLIFQLFVLSMLLHNDRQRPPYQLFSQQQLLLLFLLNCLLLITSKEHRLLSRLHLSQLLSLDLMVEAQVSIFSL